jgi:hypothetical protein
VLLPPLSRGKRFCSSRRKRGSESRRTGTERTRAEGGTAGVKGDRAGRGGGRNGRRQGTLAPAATEELDEVSVVVVAVEPAPVPAGGSQKPLQPARTSATIRGAAVIGRAAGCTGLVRLLNMVRPGFVYGFICNARPLRCRDGEVCDQRLV